MKFYPSFSVGLELFNLLLQNHEGISKVTWTIKHSNMISATHFTRTITTHDQMSRLKIVGVEVTTKLTIIFFFKC